jgi:hypothetical protein
MSSDSIVSSCIFYFHERRSMDIHLISLIQTITSETMPEIEKRLLLLLYKLNCCRILAKGYNLVKLKARNHWLYHLFIGEKYMLQVYPIFFVTPLVGNNLDFRYFKNQIDQNKS